MFKKLKKNKKGFTLVEIIVVLVILAILAAIAIPTMLGFVNDAKGKAYIAEARTCLLYTSQPKNFHSLGPCVKQHKVKPSPMW